MADQLKIIPPKKNKVGRPKKRPVLPDNIPPLPVKVKDNKIDLAKAIELRLKGLTYADIAAHFNCAKQSVQERLAPYLEGADINTDEFKRSRADILAWKQAQTLMHLTADDIQKASPRDKAIIFGTLYDKERLERGQSTNNQAVFFRIVAEAPDLPDER